jgi:hypothetical protein
VRYRPDPCTGHLAAWVEQKGEGLKSRYPEVKRFLSALDPAADAFSFRTFSDSPYTRLRGRDPLQRAIYGELKQVWDELCRLNRQGAAICVTINKTRGAERGKEDIVTVRALFLDDDNPPAEVDRFPLPPQIQVVSSPNRYHHYWLVTDLPLSAFTPSQRKLARIFGGDAKVLALNQAMQLPGFWRRKRVSQPRLPLIHRLLTSPPYNAEQIEVLLS